MAVFGAPVAHEDDPERAVRAALAIRDWAGEAMVAGDVVNTAARMQSAAPVNGVLVGETTERATRGAIDYAPGEPVAAKGKAQAVPACEALEARSHVAVEQVGGATLVGRQRELDALSAALEAARTRREPQLVTVVGVPGIGKSRLVAELFRLVGDHPDFHIWRHGRSLPYGESTPFAAFSDMVRAQAGVLDTDAADTAAAKLDEATQQLAPDDPQAGDAPEDAPRPRHGGRRGRRRHPSPELRRVAALGGGARRAEPRRARLRGHPLGRRRTTRLRRPPRRLGDGRSAARPRDGPTRAARPAPGVGRGQAERVDDLA